MCKKETACYRVIPAGKSPASISLTNGRTQSSLMLISGIAEPSLARSAMRAPTCRAMS